MCPLLLVWPLFFFFLSFAARLRGRQPKEKRGGVGDGRSTARTCLRCRFSFRPSACGRPLLFSCWAVADLSLVPLVDSVFFFFFFFWPVGWCCPPKGNPAPDEKNKKRGVDTERRCPSVLLRDCGPMGRKKRWSLLFPRPAASFSLPSLPRARTPLPLSLFFFSPWCKANLAAGWRPLLSPDEMPSRPGRPLRQHKSGSNPSGRDFGPTCRRRPTFPVLAAHKKGRPRCCAVDRKESADCRTAFLCGAFEKKKTGKEADATVMDRWACPNRGPQTKGCKRETTAPLPRVSLFLPVWVGAAQRRPRRRGDGTRHLF